ncbi:MAG: hypothetical protein Q8L53_14280 [Aestuariivirga sp.]|nr:hypothetical protein [Aestuariivirga sp.]
MTSELNLQNIFEELHGNVQQELKTARKALGHPVEKGDATEEVWNQLFNRYLPERYKALKGQVIDSYGNHSDQIDVLIIDRFYTPLVFTFKKAVIVPMESVYAVFEVKPKLDAQTVKYAREKVASVRKLVRTTRSVPTVGGTLPSKQPFRIVGGILADKSGWRPPLGESLLNCLNTGKDYNNLLDLGCAAKDGIFRFANQSKYQTTVTPKAVTLFLLELISILQELGTVAMIDMRAYIESIEKNRVMNKLKFD